MKIYYENTSIEWIETEATINNKPIKIVIGDQEFKISKGSDNSLIINKLDGSISITPNTGNEYKN